jgi:dipeptidyl aminopeptidase/acylaminoacyl peptidase
MRRTASVGILSGLMATVSVTGISAQDVPTVSHAAAILAEMSDISGVQLSPDGSWLVYSVTRRSIAKNSATTEILLQRIPGSDAPLPAPTSLPERAGNIRWCPDSRCLSMTIAVKDSPATFVRYDLATGTQTRISIRDTASNAGSTGARARVAAVGGDYRWSPTGKFVAFTAPVRAAGGTDQRRGVPLAHFSMRERKGLFTLDVATGIVTQVTADSLPIVDFGWSPDEESFAASIAEVPDDQGPWYGTDLIVVDRKTGAVRQLVKQPGADGNPSWSPDGRWIAFSTHYGATSYNSKWPAVVPAAGGTIVAFPKDETPMGPSVAWWAPDSRTFYYEARFDMTEPIARADIATRRAQLLLGPPGHLPHDDNHSMSRDGRVMVYTRETLTTPVDLFVVAIDPEGKPIGTPRQLTQLNPSFALGKLIHTDTLSWRSKDGKFTIHGLLLVPGSAVKNGKITGPLPTLLNGIGGPSMVRRGFAGEGFNGAQILFASRGYAVLVPNTRGRAGYGDAFERGIRDGKSNGRLPYEDAMGGIDLLIQRGIADSARLGVLGHSYGGFMTMYAITQTTRFKGAVVHDAHGQGILSRETSLFAPGTYQELLFRELFGVHDPFDPAERARLLEESPSLNTNKVKTPTLLQYASQRESQEYGRAFLNGLRRFNVPAVEFVYDEGHVFARPAAIADDLTRTAEWLDYWVRGIPYPDPTRAAEYEVWRKK